MIGIHKVIDTGGETDKSKVKSENQDVEDVIGTALLMDTMNLEVHFE